MARPERGGTVRWQFEGQPDGATACNCTVCRRYGVLWAYDYENEGIKVSGTTQPYVRGDSIEFHFCPVCGCVVFWVARQKGEQGRRRSVRQPDGNDDGSPDAPHRPPSGRGRPSPRFSVTIRSDGT